MQTHNFSVCSCELASCLSLGDCIWVRSQNCGCLVTWFCYQLIVKPGNKTATVPWPHPYVSKLKWTSVVASMPVQVSEVETVLAHIFNSLTPGGCRSSFKLVRSRSGSKIRSTTNGSNTQFSASASKLRAPNHLCPQEMADPPASALHMCEHTHGGGAGMSKSARFCSATAPGMCEHSFNHDFYPQAWNWLWGITALLIFSAQ